MARWIRSDDVRTGRNASYTANDDRNNVRCGRCGFICNTDRDTQGVKGGRQGWGLTYGPDAKVTTITNGVAVVTYT